VAERVLISDPTAPSSPTETPPDLSATAPTGPGSTGTETPVIAAKPASIRNAPKGYHRVTLWVTASTEVGLADVHGLVQLDGADPVPFCQLKGVQNPLARALQEAYIAVERVRARPPRMVSPPVAPVASPRPRAATVSTPRPTLGVPPELPAPPAAPTRHAPGVCRTALTSRTLVEVARNRPHAPGLPVALSGTASGQHVHLALGDVEITSRLIEGRFPDYERIIPREAATSVIVGTADFLRATRAASVLARDNANIVQLECAPPPDDGTPALGRVLVTSTSTEMGDNVSSLDASVSGDGGQIAFNGRYLRDALEALDSPPVRLQFSGAQQPGLVCPWGISRTRT